MDEDIKQLLKSMIELGNISRNETLKNKKRKKLEREWDLKYQELMNCTKKLDMKRGKLLREGRTEEEKKLKEERITIMKISWDSNPHLDHSWNPLRIQGVVEKVYEKALEKKLDKNEIKKESSTRKKQINDTQWIWRVRLSLLARETQDPKVVRTLLLAWKDYDEGRIDMERLKRIFDEYSQSANSEPSPQEFIKKYPVFNSSPPKK